MRYSPSTRGFYPEDIDYPNLPSDCTLISRQTYLALLAAQDNGKEITTDQDGKPVAVDRVISTEPPALDPRQWQFFLDVTGFRAAADSALAAMPKNTLEEKTIWAGMKAAISSSDYYRQSMALTLVAKVRAMNLGVALPTDDEVKAAWTQAAAFSLASLGV